LLSLSALVRIVRELELNFGLKRSSSEGLLAFSLCLISPMWWTELGTSFFDSSTSPLVLFALWLAIRAVSGRGSVVVKVVVAFS
jgi:hypothetical protein